MPTRAARGRCSRWGFAEGKVERLVLQQQVHCSMSHPPVPPKPCRNSSINYKAALGFPHIAEDVSSSPCLARARPCLTLQHMGENPRGGSRSGPGCQLRSRGACAAPRSPPAHPRPPNRLPLRPAAFVFHNIQRHCMLCRELEAVRAFGKRSKNLAPPCNLRHLMTEDLACIVRVGQEKDIGLCRWGQPGVALQHNLQQGACHLARRHHVLRNWPRFLQKT